MNARDCLMAACAEFIAPLEGIMLRAYRDVAGVWTIGVGHTGPEVVEGSMWTMAQAVYHFREDVAPVVDAVSRWTVPGTSFDELVPMVSLAYNIGLSAFRLSTLLQLHNTAVTLPSYRAAAQFLVWDKAHVDGVLTFIPGLERRRVVERARYLIRVAPVDLAAVS